MMSSARSARVNYLLQNRRSAGFNSWFSRFSDGNYTLANPPEAEQPSWGEHVQTVCEQVSPLMTDSLILSHKAIAFIILLALGCKLLLWALEAVITTLNFIAAVSILVTFIRPDITSMIVSRVLPPKIEQAKLWLSELFLDAGEYLRGHSQSSSSLLPASPRRARSIFSFSQTRPL